MNRNNMDTGLVMLLVLAGLAMMVGILIYTIQNDSGHTTFNPYLALVIFVPVAVGGIFLFPTLRRSGTVRWWAILAVVLGIAGVGLLVYLDKSNTLLQYEVWIQRGMP